MEKKSYNWLLFQLSQRKIILNILEVGICKREKLLDWYCLDQNNCIHRNKVSAPSNLAKYLLTYFLSKRSPILDEFSPEKPICYLYHKSGRKIISAKDASDMAKNQLHGLQINSMHMFLSGIESNTVYRVSSISNKNSELSLEITINKFEKDKGVALRNQEISDKIISFTLSLCECLARFAKPLESLKLDLIISQAGQIFLLKAVELVFSAHMNSDAARELQRVTNFKLNEDESESQSDEEFVCASRLNEREPKKKDGNKFKIRLSKPVQSNSAMFLEMVAKTIQKKRRKETINEYFMEASKREEESREFRDIIFGENTDDLIRDEVYEDRFNSMNDLLYYLEKTRPRSWVQDNIKSAQMLLKTISVRKTVFLPRRASVQAQSEFIEKLDKKKNVYTKSNATFNSKEIFPVKSVHRRAISNVPKLPYCNRQQQKMR